VTIDDDQDRHRSSPTDGKWGSSPITAATEARFLRTIAILSLLRTFGTPSHVMRPARGTARVNERLTQLLGVPCVGIKAIVDVIAADRGCREHIRAALLQRQRGELLEPPIANPFPTRPPSTISPKPRQPGFPVAPVPPVRPMHAKPLPGLVDAPDALTHADVAALVAAELAKGEAPQQAPPALPPSLQRCQEALETARDVLVDKLDCDCEKPATIAQGIAAVCKELRALHELGLRETAALCSWIGSDWAGIGNNQ